MKAIYIIPKAAAGSIVLRDGGATGPIKSTVNTLLNSTSPTYLLMAGEGLLFNSDIHVTVTDIESVMVFYG